MKQRKNRKILTEINISVGRHQKRFSFKTIPPKFGLKSLMMYLHFLTRFSNKITSQSKENGKDKQKNLLKFFKNWFESLAIYRKIGSLYLPLYWHLAHKIYTLMPSSPSFYNTKNKNIQKRVFFCLSKRSLISYFSFVFRFLLQLRVWVFRQIVFLNVVISCVREFKVET